MAISLTITESVQTLIAGVPKFLTIKSDVPATIFYTFDGSDPSVSSNIVTNDRLDLPTNQNPLIVKIWASNGSDTSIIVSEEYKSSLVGARLIRSGTNNAAAAQDYFPFGSSPGDVNPTYGQQIGTITNDLNIPGVDGYGFDGNGNSSYTLDKPASDYSFTYSPTNRLGETGRGIGTLPSNVTIRLPDSPPEISNTNSKFFNPRALVIYQSYDDTENTDLTLLNRRFFDTKTPTRDDQAKYTYTAIEGNKVQGSALRPQYNPTDQTLTFSYRDPSNNRWIFSKEKLEPTTQSNTNYFFSPRQTNTNALILKWFPFFRKRLI